jgi:hypothetical protein
VRGDAIGAGGFTGGGGFDCPQSAALAWRSVATWSMLM